MIIIEFIWLEKPIDRKRKESVKASHKHNITSTVISHLNINFSRNIYDTHIEQINSQKCSYSHNFGKNNGSSESIRTDCISQGDGTMLYLRVNIPSKLLRVVSKWKFLHRNCKFVPSITKANTAFHFTWKTE